MQNLAGDPDCDKYIESELTRCGIPLVHGVRTNTEVPYTITGALNGFTFRRAWYYWVVKGMMPLAHAIELYKHPVGKDDIRVVGYAGNIEPADPYPNTRIDPETGKIVMDQPTFDKNMEDCDRIEKRNVGFKSKFLLQYTCAVKPISEYPGYIASYHVDSELGLFLLAQHIRQLQPYPHPIIPDKWGD